MQEHYKLVTAKQTDNSKKGDATAACHSGAIPVGIFQIQSGFECDGAWLDRTVQVVGRTQA